MKRMLAVLFLAMLTDPCVSFCATNSSEDIFRQRITLLREMDADNWIEYHTDRDIDLKKFGLAVSPTNGACSPVALRISQCLLNMPRPPESVSPSPPIGDETIRRELANMGAIPVWTGRAWIDGLPLAINGYNVKEQAEKELVEVNLWDAVSRFFSGPDGDILGGARSNVQACRMSLLYLGYVVKFDTTFGIWRVTSTNIPAASPSP